jgi:hypothetical protein
MRNAIRSILAFAVLALAAAFASAQTQNTCFDIRNLLY